MSTFFDQGKELFATKMLYARVDGGTVLKDIMSEIQDNRSEIETLSRMFEHQDIKNYATDFRFPVRIKAFESLMENIKVMFKEDGYNFDLKTYWTAIYNDTAIHNMHIHKFSVLDEINYSGILYLSDIGETMFYSPNPTSQQLQYCEYSEAGKIIMFPSNIPHWVTQHKQSDCERVVMSFNFSLYEVVNK